MNFDFLNRKPKTKRAKRFLEKREPKLSENIKNAMLIKGGNANSMVTQVLKDVNVICFESYKLCFTVCPEKTIWSSV
uniref:Ribosome biogenesis protein RPF2 homolog n=1 Tax=Neovison vison TaxID=452646 RepID=A0A8C7AKD7_NEOVI